MTIRLSIRRACPQPGGHQDHRALAGIGQLKQGVGIADLNVVGAEAFLIQLLFSDSDDLIELPIAGGQLFPPPRSALYTDPGAILRWSAVR
ncbi:hypothetical protein LNP74_01220 [Klebsiella pneumoniae subsp. pneumoniae]|nr:hypothetical protein [Klebsiella pneumoniae subsp. pneumoniae]